MAVNSKAMKEFIENTYLEMVDSLAGLGDDPAQSGILAQRLAFVAKALAAIRGHITVHPFETEADEIGFFKYIKPRFYSWNIYLVEQFALLHNIPPGTKKMRRSYLLGELRYITRTRARHISAFRYYHDDDTHRDERYFLRRNLEPIREGQEYAMPDPGFTTNMDYLFSKFRALDMLEDYIIEQVQLLENSAENSSSYDLRWTGDKVNLVELAYGLFYTGQLNDGNADIMDIISWLRDSLSIPITREQAYRIWLDIRRRKVIPYTRFIDQMHDRLITQIEQSFR